MYYNSYCGGGRSLYSAKVKDNEDSIVLEVPVPGFDKKDLNLSIEEDQLIIKAKNEENDFERVYILGEKINRENVKAEVVNGMLKVTFGKVSPKSIEISIN